MGFYSRIRFKASKASFRFRSNKKTPHARGCFYFGAGKKVQISNHFAKDLGEILDFIDRFRPEIDAIGKEPEISEK